MNDINTKAKTRQQLAEEYGVCVRTLNKWLTEQQISIKRGLISPGDQKKIYSKLGLTFLPKNPNCKKGY